MYTARSRILTIMVIFVVSTLALTGCVAATKSEVAPTSGEITVVGKGEAVGKPDQAQIQVGVDVMADSVDAAASQNQAVIDKIMSALTAQGVQPDDIQTTNYNVWVEQVYPQGETPQVGGYHVSNQVNVTIRDINKVSEVIAAVIDAGANNIYGVTFSVADPTSLEADARAKAMEDAKARATELARLGGVELSDIKVISETITQPGMPGAVYGIGGGAEAPSIAPGQLTYLVQIQVTYNIK